ncbi:spondin domain-containing protein [Algirhabdus cladophorae]|uniref:spondin domain-containing protein n=1 Tax=Algirhabdus cladophorae TaxID=3377108 RepID=UPI003B848644
MTFILKASVLGAALALTTSGAQAASVKVTIENLSEENGLYLTPLLNVFHDGTYAGFTEGQAASTQLEAIAEEGMVGSEIDRVNALNIGAQTAVATGPAGFGSMPGQPPVLDAGEVSSFTIDLDPTSNRYFSFLSMVIPSNDTFIGNSSATAYELFDGAGLFTDLATIFVDIDDVWDGGTEENDGQGAAFSTAGGTATDTTGTVSSVSSLDFLFGQPTAAGFIVDGADVGTRLASISFSQVAPVPLPAGMPLLLVGLGVMGLARRRQNRS